MTCRDVEVRRLNLKTIGRLFDDQVAIRAGSAACVECDPDKADKRLWQRLLIAQHLPELTTE
jgi:hypothetical protein